MLPPTTPTLPPLELDEHTSPRKRMTAAVLVAGVDAFNEDPSLSPSDLTSSFVYALAASLVAFEVARPSLRQDGGDAVVRAVQDAFARAVDRLRIDREFAEDIAPQLFH